jgi:hypothetical protein
MAKAITIDIINSQNLPSSCFQLVERTPETDGREFCNEATAITGPEEALFSFFEAHLSAS